MPPVVRSLLLASAVTAVLVVVGVVVLDRPDTGPATTSAPTGPASSAPAPSAPAIDDLLVQRRPFCPDVPSEAVETALGGTVLAATVYGDGDDITVEDTPDVAHEDGCRWEAAVGTKAAAWVFVPPVTVPDARVIASHVARTKGCTLGRPPAYGAPSLAVVCEVDGTRIASQRGLFGDAWLTCTLEDRSATVAALMARTQTWCAAVARAASTS